MPTQEDVRFAQAAIKAGYLDKEKAQELLQAQKVAEEASGSRISFNRIAVNKNVLTSEQVKAVEEHLGLGAKPKVKQFGPYLVQKRIGQGGMGAVYLAVDTRVNTPVALKTLAPGFGNDQTYLQRFQREASIASEVKHPNVVACYGAGVEQNIHYMALEYVDGGDVSHLIRQGPVPEAKALEIASQVTEGLGAAHQAGLVHRDIKPANIFMTKDGTAKLGDLGLARAEEDHSLTQSAVSLGTPHYMSPEQAQGQREIDIRSDIYSLGATIYHMVCGEPPFSGPTAIVVLSKHAQEQIPSPQEKVPELSDGICHIIEKCMAKEKDDRYQTPAELLEDIRLVMKGEKPASDSLPANSTSVRRLTQAATVAEPGASRRRGSRRTATPSRTPIVAGALVLLLLVGGGIFLATRPKPEPSKKSGVPRVKATTSVEPVAPKSPSPEQMLCEAEDYAKKHPENFREIIARFQKAVEATKGTENEAKAREGLADREERWEAAALAKFEERKAAADENVDAGQYSKAKKLWDSFPESLLTDLVKEEIGKETTRIQDALDSFVERLRKAAEPLLAKTPDALTDEDVEALVALKEKVEKAPEGLDEKAKLALDDLAEELAAALDAHAEALRAMVAAAFEQFWRDYETHVREKRFDKAARLASDFPATLSGAEAGEKLAAALKMLKQDAGLLRTLFDSAAKNLPKLKGTMVRVSGMGMTVTEVRDGKVFVKHGEAEVGLDPEKLDADTILSVALSSVEDPVSKARQRGLHAFYYGSEKEAAATLKEAAEAGADVAFYLARLVPVLVITTIPPGADVRLETMADGKWQEVEGEARKTPLREEVAKNTKFRVEISKEGSYPVTQEAVVGDGGEYRVCVRLKRARLWDALAADFEVPKKLKDRYDNPIRKGIDKKTGLPFEIRHKKTGMHFVSIPAGEFMMGSPEEEKAHAASREKPQHRVRISKPFYMGKYEVTQGEWQRVTGKNPSEFQSEGNPVEKVPWNACPPFIKRLSEKLSNQNAGGRFSLPTEAQWEYACRAGTTTRFYYGEDPSYKELGDYAWHGKNADGRAHRVGQKKPNAWGLYDMYGNVHEWCQDRFGPYSGEAQTDPVYLKSSSGHVLRGGGWNTVSGCQSAYRAVSALGIRGYLGLRLALDLPTEKRKSRIPRDAKAFGGHHYKLFDERLPWSEAKRKCEEMGGHLVTIGDARENQFVAGLPGLKAAWIGLTDSAVESHWLWVTGERVQFLNWQARPRQPDGGRKQNVAFIATKSSRGGWVDGDQTKGFSFICEWDE